MSAEIFYFSGTGNTLAAARDIAGKIGGRLISIPSVISDSITPEADTIGIIFPVYHQGIPYIIKRFVDKMDDLSGKYIFGVCTCGGSPSLALEYLDRAIRLKGGKLGAGFYVKMPYNYIAPSFVLKDFLKSFKLGYVGTDKQKEMFSVWDNKLEFICKTVRLKKIHKLETRDKFIEGLVDRLNLRDSLQKKVWLKIAGVTERINLPFIECLQIMDNGFNTDDKCNSCGICSKVCPVKNIEMVDGKPIWKHQCEQCFACLQWCPKEAVQFGRNTSGCKRYHHPGVILSDMINT